MKLKELLDSLDHEVWLRCENVDYEVEHDNEVWENHRPPYHMR